jgi:hypothetical protein
MKRFILHVLTYCFIFNLSFAHAETINQQLAPHLHGTATLQVAVDQQNLTLLFSGPLDNLLGFEHKARNQAEVAQVQNMIKQFYKTNLFLPSKAAQCKLQTVNLESVVIKKKVIKKKPPPESTTQHGHEEDAGHADLDAELFYQCNHIKNLRDLQVNLFKAFPNLHQLNLEIVSERGQSAAKLTPNNNQAFW